MFSDRPRYSSDRNILKRYLKTALIVLSILVICGIVALGLSNVTLLKTLPSAASCGKRIVGYYTEWEAPEVTENQLRKLTHVIFLFAAIYEDGSARFWDEHGESRFLTLKEMAKKLNTGLKVMIGVGGYMVSPRFGPIVSDSKLRKKLISDIASIIDEHDLDGVEIFWIFPGQTHKKYYLKLIRELREKLSQMEQIKNRAEAYILSIVAPKFKVQLKNGYDLKRLLEYADFIDVLTYDYFNKQYSSDRGVAGPTAPLYGGNGKNIEETMKYLVCETREPTRINMAISFYGTFWHNVNGSLDDDSVDIWTPTESNLHAVRWRELEGDGWNKSSSLWHDKSKSSYIWIEETKTFLGFENERSLEEKIKYARDKNLGGFVIWAIDQDDDENTLLNVLSPASLCNENDRRTVNYVCEN
ncbi:hypothetical protein CRE_32636 [Caenorhabditis remanei]|uniref:GH18 domain-containing protein n=1 Tax=Caenorhabditis remanei TaxID=31234 RepID=E3LH05_CAERE|nr:hypothetical protein CRE_32636 [Caenorhabditis remanei]